MESTRKFSDRIADALASGSVLWRSVAPDQGLPLCFDGRPFVLSLWMAAQDKGLARPTWLGRQRIKELGGHLKAGATPATAFLRGRIPRRQPGAADDLSTVDVWQAAEVWCIDEIDGLANHLYRGGDEIRRDDRSPDPVISGGGEARLGSFVETLDGWEGTGIMNIGETSLGL